ncbi:hypothetical protein KC19_10G059200 [Ceratodon purpureus]|uniref:Uncharacterized protein n=1 Tax=Ceratodon purpureus TaxID=3225 RepID=A0A8T0GJV0_CERPU|nr:hypothetical protein KC19_10G059200 [Ceratodon purpureus]
MCVVPVAVMMVTSIPSSQCSSSCSRFITSSSVGRWIEENSRLNDVVFQVRSRRGSVLSSSGYRAGCCVSRVSRSFAVTGAVVESSGLGWGSDGEAGGEGNWHAQLGSEQSWLVLLGGVKGWLLGLVMAGLIVAGEAAPSESQAAMPVPRSPRTGYDPVSEVEREASSAFARRVTEALELLDKARKAQASEDFLEALRCYSLITQKSGDLALAEYARVGRALTLYEVGDRAEAIAEMEDMSLSLKGYPEVHAALAAALYADKHAPVPAEQQFTFATLLDRRYTDPSWVKSAKHWPPSLIDSLERFIALK